MKNIKSFILLLLTSILAVNLSAQVNSIKCEKINSINSESNDFYPIFIDSTTLYITSDKKVLTEEKINNFSQNIYSVLLCL